MTSLLRRSFRSGKNVKQQQQETEFDSLENIVPVIDNDGVEEVLSGKRGISLFGSTSPVKIQVKSALKKNPLFNRVSTVQPSSSSNSRNVESEPAEEDKENASPRPKNVQSKSVTPNSVEKTARPVDVRFVSTRPTVASYSPSQLTKGLSNVLITPPKRISKYDEPEFSSEMKYSGDDEERQSRRNRANTDFSNGSDLHESKQPEPHENSENYQEYIATVFSKARHNHINYVMEEIEKNNFDTNTQDEYGNTLLHICAQNNHRKLASLILAHSANTNLNLENLKQLTPLDYCEKYGFLKMCDWLISCGAESRVQYGYTPQKNYLR
jgi:hypothetical protein